MVSPEQPSHFPMATKRKAFSVFTEGLVFVGGSIVALLFLWTLWSFLDPSPKPNLPFQTQTTTTAGVDLLHDPPEENFYDDPELSYPIDKPVKKWDEKRKEWLKHHPSFAGGARDRVLLVTGSQPGPCSNPIGDHLLLRFFKNKVDYCRIHGYDIFYNNALLHPKMYSFWAKIPVIRAAMLAHPEAEWIYWVDSDAAFTDMDFKLPLERYSHHNLVVHGWAHLIYDAQSWTSLNAGVFLIRNCQWSMDFMEVWASMGPNSPEYYKWGPIQKSLFKDKIFPESDDQAALVYLILKEKDKWADKIYLEGEYNFEGYWLGIVGKFDNITQTYTEIDRRVRRLRRRHAEKVSESYAELRKKHVKEAGLEYGTFLPFITHFTGCQPCSGDHNQNYSGQSCWHGMQRALNFADNQVLRNFGFHHPNLLEDPVSPLPFDFPAD